MPNLAALIHRNQNAYEQRMANELRTFSTLVSTIVNQYARERNATGDLVVPNDPRTRANLKSAIWEQATRRYFGAQDTQLDGVKPLNPFMTLIRDGIYSATRVSVEYQLDILQKNASPDVYRFLTGQRAPQFAESTTRNLIIKEQDGSGLRRLVYDPWHLFVDPNGYTLSERGWNTAQEVRIAIDALLDQQIPLGTSAVNIADMLERYLYPEAARIRTRTPYGYDGSYWARRLARTEISAAAGRSTYNASLLNPFVDGMDWRLSGSHPKPDICDDYAAGSPYRLEDVPGYPAHPHDLCTLVPRVSSNRAEINRQIQGMLIADYDTPYIINNQAYTRRNLQGIFNIDFLLGILLTVGIYRYLND